MTATIDRILRTDPEAQRLLVELFRECGDLREFGARVLEKAVNAMMSAQADEACGAAYGRRDEARENSRNGYRRRSLETSVGTIGLEVPKLRHGTYYPSDLLERYTRVERSLVAAVVEMYALGISTRKVRRIAEELGVDSLSKDQVSAMCASLDEEVAQYTAGDLSGRRCCYLWIDATYVKCRVDGRYASSAVVTAIALDEGGTKRFIGLDVVDTESEASWKAFLRGLRARGLSGVRLVVSDAHPGIVAAVAEVMQGAAWQRCVFHLMRNAADAEAGHPDRQAVVRACLSAAVAQRDRDLVRACWQRAASRLAEEGCARAAALVADAEADALAYLDFPAQHWQKVRTNNAMERANREIKRRTRVVQTFPSRESLLRLVGAVVVECSSGWGRRHVFSPGLTALAWEPADTRAPEERRRALEAARPAAARVIEGAIAEARAKLGAKRG